MAMESVGQHPGKKDINYQFSLENIKQTLEHYNAVKGKDDPANRAPFKYFNKGSMATISRNSAVAQVGKLEFSGYFAWLAWLVLHLYYLVGHRNRIAALFSWWTSFVGSSRGQLAITSQMIYARVVTQMMEAQTQGALAAAEQAEQAEQKAAG